MRFDDVHEHRRYRHKTASHKKAATARAPCRAVLSTVDENASTVKHGVFQNDTLAPALKICKDGAMARAARL